MEQLFLIYETYEGFWRALRDRKKIKFLDSLGKGVNVQNIAKSISSKSDEQIIKELGLNIKGITTAQFELVNERIMGITGMWRNAKFVESMEKLFIPMFYSIKHKMMLFEKDGKILFVFGDEKEKQADIFVEQNNLKGGFEVKRSIDIVLDISKRLNVAIIDMICLRLTELGIQPDELSRLAA